MCKMQLCHKKRKLKQDGRGHSFGKCSHFAWKTGNMGILGKGERAQRPRVTNLRCSQGAPGHLMSEVQSLELGHSGQRLGS